MKIKHIIIYSIIFTAGLTAARADAASSLSAAVSGNATANAAADGYKIDIQSKGNSVDVKTVSYGAASASAQAENGSSRQETNSSETEIFPEIKTLKEPIKAPEKFKYDTPQTENSAPKKLKNKIDTKEKRQNTAASFNKKTEAKKIALKNGKKNKIKKTVEESQNERISKLEKRIQIINALLGWGLILVAVSIIAQLTAVILYLRSRNHKIIKV